MPIYEYKCQECGNVMEFFVRSRHRISHFSCPDCKSKNLQKLYSVPSVFIRENSRPKGSTCCGSNERCETPPCSDGGACRRD